ncbi:MAG: DUF4199 domain-containing protein [Bacteroidia bacterium]|nr:DUF4199 domain-containing protein [Bacteroidia bacterium]MDW8345406.1 DUF4199 domain-containing protein [Bacteroidia bacterium]
MTETIKKNVLIGTVLALMMILGFLMGSYIHALFYQIVMFVVILVLPLILMLYTRKKAGGYLNYGKTFQAGFLPILTGIFILSLFYFVYLQYINPLAFEYEKQKTTANLKAAGISDEIIKDTTAHMRPIKTAFTYFLTFWIISTLACLFYAAFCYKSEVQKLPY